MSQILSTVQMRQIRADREELERYRLTGLTPEGVVQLMYHYKDLQQQMMDPAPLPMDLRAEDIDELYPPKPRAMDALTARPGVTANARSTRSTAFIWTNRPGCAG